MAQNYNQSNLNETFLDLDRLNDAYSDLAIENGQGKLNKSDVHYADETMLMSTSAYDEKMATEAAKTASSSASVATAAASSKFNSFPMRRHKKPPKLKQTPKSVSSLHPDTARTVMDVSESSTSHQHHRHHYAAVAMSQDELEASVRAAHTRPQDNERLKQIIRTNYWPIKHPIRRYLWKCLLRLSGAGDDGGGGNSGDEAHNKENSIKTELVTSEVDYNRHLDRIFGKSREIDVPLPEFVNPTLEVLHNNNTLSTTISTKSHLNYYYLNGKGRDAVKRILCVYEYHYPQVTHNPLLVSVASILLHYMQEHEVFAALCIMSASKDHFIESKSSWETSSAVFTKLLKTYCKSSYEVITKYAIDSLELIFEQWIWWIFDCLSFEFLVKIMDCYIFEGQKILYRVSLAIVQQFSKNAKSENVKVNKDSIKKFCTLSFSLESIEKLLKTSFNIRNLKRSVIKEIFVKEEAKRKNFGVTTQSGVNQANGEDTIEMMPNQNSPSRIFVNETTTSILSHANLCTIWNWLPQRLSVYSPSMLFTTQEDGTSFNTLFNVLDNLEYSLIVIKTFQDEIFGAFCAGYWNERKENQLYFGTGETFLFTVAPEKKCFKWVGSRGEKTSANQEMFLRADQNKISIGGGAGVGLTISSNLTEGATARCDTFENEPLASMASFQISILEVIGFISMNT